MSDDKTLSQEQRLCIFCKHWRFHGAEAGYSELTPGSDASMECTKNQWTKLKVLKKDWAVFCQIDSSEDFRSVISAAQRCDEYEQAGLT